MFLCRVACGEWETTVDVRVFGVCKTVVTLVSCVDLVAHVYGVTAVWVTVVVMVSDACVAANVYVSDVCAAATMCVSGVFVCAFEGSLSLA
jgi:hypothetical protein